MSVKIVGPGGAAGTNAAARMSDVTGGSGGQVVVGSTNTIVAPETGIWVQTDGSGNIVTIWIENGL